MTTTTGRSTAGPSIGAATAPHPGGKPSQRPATRRRRGDGVAPSRVGWQDPRERAGSRGCRLCRRERHLSAVGDGRWVDCPKCCAGLRDAQDEEHAERGLSETHNYGGLRTFAGATALEPGGPSWVLRSGGLMPVYRHLAALDTLDFATNTIWSDDSRDWVTVRRQLIGEAGTPPIEPASYDAVFASHVIEHLANPIGALRRWRRLVKPGGHILLVVPHYEGSFDHRRSVTSLDHLLADAEHETGEADLSHLDEALALFDPSRDDPRGAALFEQRVRANPSTRALHHHVFDSRAAVAMCEAAGLTIRLLRPRRPYHIFCVCSVDDGSVGKMDVVAALRRSPFESDRLSTV